MRDLPVVVELRGEVTGMETVIPVGQIPMVMKEWFPTVTKDARAVIERLEAQSAAGDWATVDDCARYLAISVLRLS